MKLEREHKPITYPTILEYYPTTLIFQKYSKTRVIWKQVYLDSLSYKIIRTDWNGKHLEQNPTLNRSYTTATAPYLTELPARTNSFPSFRGLYPSPDGNSKYDWLVWVFGWLKGSPAHKFFGSYDDGFTWVLALPDGMILSKAKGLAYEIPF